MACDYNLVLVWFVTIWLVALAKLILLDGCLLILISIDSRLFVRWLRFASMRSFNGVSRNGEGERKRKAYFDRLLVAMPRMAGMFDCRWYLYWVRVFTAAGLLFY